MEKQKLNSKESQNEKIELPGDPVYSSNDDIYSRAQKESLNSEEESPLDQGLDVPGSELDNADEMIGEEDEENNYYSIGGDDHNDLDEDE